jgi:protein-S-isoprenylcysteine O-methyltransferase Ste14
MIVSGIRRIFFEEKGMEIAEPGKGKKALVFWTIIVYCLIGIEIIIMISPFALYFYSVYGPVLQTLAAHPLTSWSTEFFLPHLVFPDDPLIRAISLLQVLMLVGLVLFFLAAIPLYYGRFTGKGVVARSFYGRIRHPQYLFLAISGFGLMLYWPRFIILIMYLTMLFVYYALARNEESRMRHEQPRDYAGYMAKTPMFLPGEPGGRLYRLLFGRIQPKWLGIAAAYCLTIPLAVLLAMGLRSYTVRTLPMITVAGSHQIISVFPRPEREILAVYQAALGSARVREALRTREVNAVYLLPGDFFLNALLTEEDRRFSDEMLERFPEILEWHQHRFSGGLGRFFRIFYNFVRTWSSVETDYEVERLIFMRVDDAAGRLVSPSEIFKVGLKRRPVLLVDLEAAGHAVRSVVKTTDNHKWGLMPMPTF